MGLPPLEFSECYLDSPQFRERLRIHEAELEKTSKFIKELLKAGKALIQADMALSQAQEKFNQCLQSFNFEIIGDAETDDEGNIAVALQEFAELLRLMDEERSRVMENAQKIMIRPLESFRQQLETAKEEKKKFEKQTEKYYSLVEKNLGLSFKKKEAQFAEHDKYVEQERSQFCETSLQYISTVQAVQERKMFEFIEPLLAFTHGLCTAYHQGYEYAKDFNLYKIQLQMSIQRTRDRFESTRSEVERLKQKVRESPEEHKRSSDYTVEGYLYVLEKRPFGTTWVKSYSKYKKSNRQFIRGPSELKTSGKPAEEEEFTVRSCVRKRTDAIDRRFCFDVDLGDRAGVLTLQALSEDSRKQWMEAMDGREPIYERATHNIPEETTLNDMGFQFIRKCIQLIEADGLEEQGLYRIVAPTTRVQKLLSLLNECHSLDDLDLENDDLWDVKILSGTVKAFLRNLPEPLMTFRLHQRFITAAKMDNEEDRIECVHGLVYDLPESHRQMLNIIIAHISNVASHSKENLMTVANLAVCFGPTVMRPEVETVAALIDIKFQNIVIEILVENYDKIFQKVPSNHSEFRKTHISARARRYRLSIRKPPPYRPPDPPTSCARSSSKEARSGSRNGSVKRPMIPPQPPPPVPGGGSGGSGGSGGGSSGGGSGRGSFGAGASAAVSVSSAPAVAPGQAAAAAIPSSPPAGPAALLDKMKRHGGPSSNLRVALGNAETAEDGVGRNHSPLLPPNPGEPGFPEGSSAEEPCCARQGRTPVRRRSMVTSRTQMFENRSSRPNPPMSPHSRLGLAVWMVSRKARAIADFKSDDGTVLDFSKGDIFHNVQPAMDGWLKGSLNGKNGLIPEQMLQML
ncbi:rho GTPase-activating protein 10 isoform X2 [Lethenteron reissneri]|uniref:rho GTPase-activating protein 10 isoform X2 n=1 Tax=Lethenteron reissneri TaxID=7753 RepID=UPI002AB7833C|nr:rho GTPase-activating protein 10 isoform X2 [Lethenteron reissneri]